MRLNADVIAVSDFDPWLLVTVSALLAFGIIMVASASMVVSDSEFGSPFHYLIHQLFYLILGVGLAYYVTRLPVIFWQHISGYLLVISLVLLVVILVPGIGHTVNGSQRWIHLGFINLQASEFAKLAAIIYLAGYIQRHQVTVQNKLVGFINPMIVLALLSVLLLMEPDFGAVAVLAITFMTLLYLGGVRTWPFIVLMIVVAAALALLAVASPYRMARLTAFLNPWQNEFGSGYQLTQSLIAFGRGGLFGVGLGNSVQKLFYLPEAHTDFLFAVVGEELGFIGELLLLILFVIFIARIFKLAMLAYQQDQLFMSYLASGIGLWVALQAMINIGVNIGVLPTKGLTLPFMSYGGSSMLINCLVVGILLRISYELQRET